MNLKGDGILETQLQEMEKLGFLECRRKSLRELKLKTVIKVINPLQSIPVKKSSYMSVICAQLRYMTIWIG
jgi:hypothetical protein